MHDKKQAPTRRRDGLKPTTISKALEQVHEIMMEDIMRSGGGADAIESAYNWLGQGLEYAPVPPRKVTS